LCTGTNAEREEEMSDWDFSYKMMTWAAIAIAAAILTAGILIGSFINWVIL